MVSECINFAVYKCLHRSSFGDVSSPVPFFWNEGGMVGCLQRGKLPNNSQEHETFAVSNRQVPKLWWFVFFFGQGIGHVLQRGIFFRHGN